MTDENAPPSHHVIRLRSVSWLVLALFVAVAIGMFVVAHRLAGEQEGRLLKERTAEVGLVLSGSVGAALQASLTSLATAAQQSPAAFTVAARGSASSTLSVALVSHQNGSWLVQAAVGSGLTVGQILTGPRQSFLGSAGNKIHTDILTLSPNQSRLVVELGPPTAPADTVIYEEYAVDPSKPSRSPSRSRSTS